MIFLTPNIILDYIQSAMANKASGNLLYRMQRRSTVKAPTLSYASEQAHRNKAIPLRNQVREVY